MEIFRKIVLCSNWHFTKTILVALWKINVHKEKMVMCVIVQVKGYDGFTKGRIIRESKEETIFRMPGNVT